MKAPYSIGDKVFLVSDLAGQPYFVTGIVNRGNGKITILVSALGFETEVLTQEISTSKSVRE